MKSAILIFSLSLLAICICVYGQDPANVFLHNVDSIRILSFKRITHHRVSIKNVPLPIVKDQHVFACKLLPDGYESRYSQKIYSIKPVDTTIKKDTSHSSPPNTIICGPSRASLISLSPLFVLKNNNRIASDSIFYNINPKVIKKIDVLKNDSAKLMYGNRAANGVIVITLIEDSVILTVERLLRLYNISQKFKESPLYIDNKPFPKDQLLLQRSAIKSVDLVNDHIEITMFDKPWNIIPKKKNADKDEIIIR